MTGRAEGETRGGLLERMRAASLARLERARALESPSSLQRRARATPLPPALALSEEGFDIIAEVKLRSPSAGALAGAALDPGEQALGYARAGAAAVSVLTEPDEFAGSLEHLQQAAAALAPLGVPAMRKDFLVDPYQIWEARAAGAGGALVILAMLDDAEVRALLASSAEAGLFVLLEAFDAEDLARAHALLSAPVPNLLLGLNCRDLRSLAVDRDRFGRLREAFPSAYPAVAESGLATPEDVAWVAGLGYRAALIGSALMTHAEPEAHLRQMLAAGRAAS